MGAVRIFADTGTDAGKPWPGGIVPRIVVVASADAGLRARLRSALEAVRWQVFEAGGGAAAMALLEDVRPEALLVDSWLPDLEAGEFASNIEIMYPAVELLRLTGKQPDGEQRSPRRHELLLAMREAQEVQGRDVQLPVAVPPRTSPSPGLSAQRWTEKTPAPPDVIAERRGVHPSRPGPESHELLPDMVGTSAEMQELAQMIRLVAPRSTTVLIEGETGTGKELVAKALHVLSARSHKPFTVLNCAAIPEALLEAELFGHTRGAFTGAVQSRTGRIEAAHGGTLFLDEIGEMPLGLQPKLLRFLECGELQRVGDNEAVRVDVRVVAATHQPLEQRAEENSFRLDLYHRLAVFPVEVPPLRDRMDDIPLLAERFLARMGRGTLRKEITPAALDRLFEHRWPGNVRELMHVLERAAILSGDSAEISQEDIRVRRRERS